MAAMLKAETMKQFCMKIDLISQGRENVLFLPSNMATMTSHEMLYRQLCEHGDHNSKDSQVSLYQLEMVILSCSPSICPKFQANCIPQTIVDC